ncbi:MAG: hypothetical protein GTO45_04335, partial [Candidatus Aminicenantes bacterium]|nr:hypothetical protein [Candidatus Aminicenantes bacterium]NIM77968.1 hypothetical protein [Candidatus Aminicenantes bacterium]NIN83965.1 hypothetical protein [Candidatus Aminicenantes bacterium]NIO79890.1 hypothetical protein [Candidatus Aminicenantes bacterium]NIQ65855.1 hypothetical protein [Candidatus Aminicenantes bacterium]
MGNITSISTTVPGFDAGFIYDGLYRLTSASYSGGKSYSYTYDDYGNLEIARENGIIVSDLSYDGYNRIDTSGFDYDDRGNMTEAPGYRYV